MTQAKPKVDIFTDGACRGNPGKGGWGTLLRFGDHEKELKGYQAQATNNQMELMAAIQGLEVLKCSCDVKLTTDSTYVRNGISQWMANWKLKGWRTSKGEMVKNVELWKRLDEAAQYHDIEWLWVKGHSGHVENERVDALANAAIDEQG